MDPLTLSLIAKGVVGAGQMISGMNKPDAPEYKIPSALKQNLALAQSAYANPYMPGEQRASDKIDLSAANALSAARDMNSGVSGVSKVQAGTNKAKLDLAAKSAEFNRSMLDRLTAAQKDMARAQDTKWQMNEFAPYKDAMVKKENQIGAGLTNMFGAVDQGLAMRILGGSSITDATPSLPQGEIKNSVETVFDTHNISDVFSTSAVNYDSNIG